MVNTTFEFCVAMGYVVNRSWFLKNIEDTLVMSIVYLLKWSYSITLMRNEENHYILAFHCSLCGPLFIGYDWIAFFIQLEMGMCPFVKQEEFGMLNPQFGNDRSSRVIISFVFTIQKILEKQIHMFLLKLKSYT